MATRIEKILAGARRTLADPRKQRWTDEDLLAILDEGQMDFCQQTEVLKGESYVYLEAGKPVFDLPADCWRLTRALTLGSKLPFLSHYQIDSQNLSYRGPFGQSSGSSWETKIGTPQAIVYDRRSQTQAKVFPIPEVGAQQVVEGSAVAATAQGGDYVVDPYGISVAITGYTLDPLEGVLAEGDTYGVVSEADDLVNPGDSIIPEEEEDPGVLRLYYTRIPTTEYSIVEDAIVGELESPPVYDIALKFYVVGQALLNDLDTAYQQKGAQQLAIYDRHVATAKRDRASNFSRAHNTQTMYRRGV